MKKIITFTKEELNKLYIIENLTVDEIAKKLLISIASVNRFLKKFDIKKPESLRAQKISKTKQAMSDAEKKEYANKISKARIGKGLGIEPWNKGKHIDNHWFGKHHSEASCKKISETKMAKTPEEKTTITKKRLASRIYGAPWNKGKCLPANTKIKIRQTLMNKTQQEKNIMLQQRISTMKQNKSFNSSKPEETYYNYLLTKYKKNDIIRQYATDKRYPFACDFYIKSLDLFIELNISWTHGGHQYCADNQADKLKLATWHEKALTSNFYKNAIETWTIRDPKKQEIAKANKINYIVYYTEEELYE